MFLSLPLLYQQPKQELTPTEDQANILTAIKAPQHANLDYVERFAHKLDAVYTAIPETVNRWIINGTDGPAASFGGIILSDWQKRSRSASAIQAHLQAMVGDVEGSSIFVFQSPALPGSTGGLPVQMVLRSPQDYPALYQTMEKIKQRARESGLFVVVDSLGIRMQDIGESLAVLVGENYINRFGMEGRSYDVISQSLRDQRLTPLALGYATMNIYTQIGLVTLIGLISKHGILMVAFANESQVYEGLERGDAILHAAQIRLRPILMTTAAMVFGLVPLLFASGAGANSRFGLEVVIVSGMLVDTLFTLFVLPTMYTLLARNHTASAMTTRQRQLDEAELPTTKVP